MSNQSSEDSIQQAFDQATALAAQGQLAEAERRLAMLHQARPDDPAVMARLGDVINRLGRPRKALHLFNRARELLPDDRNLRAARAGVLQQLDRADEAEAEYRALLEGQADDAGVLFNLAKLLTQGKRHDEAEALLRRAIAAKPDFSLAYNLLASIKLDLQLYGELEEVLRAGYAQTPGDPQVVANLLRCLRIVKKYDDALEVAAKAEAELGDHKDVALAIADMHASYGMDLLRAGKWEEGWREYEWRLRTSELGGIACDDVPLWDGSRHETAALLLIGEQGIGDLLQFCRYIPLVAERFGGRVMLMTHGPVGRLMEQLPVEILKPGVVPPVIARAQLLSLPYIFGTTEATIPCQVPYLRAPAECVAEWKRRLPADGTFKVGLVWAGNPGHVRDRFRSLSLAQLAPVLQVPGVSFHSLQVGPREPDLQQPEGAGIVNLAPLLTDMAETAGALEALDLLIAVDTSVVHLAGAIGRPFWVMVAKECDWRWLEHRPDSPWYPSGTVFRQAKELEWEPVIARVAQALADQVRR